MHARVCCRTPDVQGSCMSHVQAWQPARRKKSGFLCGILLFFVAFSSLLAANLC